jgi:hypothetical protein
MSAGDAMSDAGDFLHRYGDRSYQGRRVVKSERIKLYQRELVERIDADARAGRRNHEVWRILKDIDRSTVAERVLVAGILVASSTDLGGDRDGEQNYRDVRDYVGSQVVGEQADRAEFDVGDWAIDRLIELPIFELDWRGVPTFADDDLGDWIRWALTSNPFMLPPTEAPPEWRDVIRRHGWATTTLVKAKKSRDQMRRDIRAGKMWLPLEVLTALERVEFVINEPVLRIAQQMAPIKIPAAPEWMAAKKVAQWRIAASKEAREHIKATRRLAAYNLDMVMAEMLVGQSFVTPLHLDFRGRVYSSSFFNFQRADSVRGLFLFAKGARIDDESMRWLKGHVAARADGLHGEKPSRGDLDARIAWTMANLGEVRRIGEAVGHGDVPAGIDKVKEPVQFLAACHELVQALNNPNFVSRLPLTFDCSCSGLQHISMMTRDEVGARHSNVVPSEVAQDFYARVASRAGELLGQERWYCTIVDGEAAKLDEPNEWLRPILIETARKTPGNAAKELNRRGIAAPDRQNRWRNDMIKKLRDSLGVTVKLRTFATETERDSFIAAAGEVINSGHIDVVIDRDIAKKPVMSYFYSATRKSMTRSIAKYLKDEALPTTGASKIADAIYRAVEHEVPQARAVRVFLQRIAKLYAKANKLAHWPTPSGLHVFNLADEAKIKRKSKKHKGVRRRTKIATGTTGKVDSKAAARAITANYTHSMDATVLHLVAYLMRGIDLVTVHDCFGALARDAAHLNWTIRNAFALTYEGFFPTHHPATGAEMKVFDHLLRIAAKDLPGVKLPDPPRFGDLNVGQVRHSHHACK